jgi:hypothetical protein
VLFVFVLFDAGCSDDTAPLQDSAVLDDTQQVLDTAQQQDAPIQADGPVQTDGPAPVPDGGPQPDAPLADGPTPQPDGPTPQPDGPTPQPDGPGPAPDSGPLPDANLVDLGLQKCGPFPGGTCATDEVCDITGCAPGATGVCVTQPKKCNKIYMPVCGCDDVTYGNDCLRLMAGVPLKHTGACQTAPDSGTPDSGTPLTDGGLGKLCGPIPGGTCGPGLVCDIKGCLLGATGVCVTKPVTCPYLWAPVCGCDGLTYANDCLRLMAGTALDHTGPCLTAGDGGVIPWDGGVAIQCGGPMSTPCPPGWFCNILSCGKNASGACEIIPSACPMIWAPVCGCDGVTYGNDCLRKAAGVPLDHTGQC